MPEIYMAIMAKCLVVLFSSILIPSLHGFAIGPNSHIEQYDENKSFETSKLSEATHYARLMVIGGNNEAGPLSNVEMLDPFNAASNCSKPPDFPQQRYYMVAQSIKNEPTVCGGYSNNTFANVTMEEECFRLDNKTKRWEFKGSASLIYPRAYAADILVNDSSWWVAGGYHWYYPSFTSSDILYHNKSTFLKGSLLPDRLVDHCMAAINESHAFIVGGSYGSGQQGNWLVV